MILIQFDSGTVAAGSFLSGDVTWRPDEDDDPAPREIVVSAEWDIEGSGYPTSGRARSTRFTPAGDGREFKFPFRLLIPYDGPISFEGELMKVVWTLNVRADKRGLDERTEVEFRVEPRVVTSSAR